MTSKELILRLKHLSDTNKEISQRITKLSKYSPSEDDQADSDSRSELGDEIHQSLKELEEEFEIFRQEAEEFTSSSDGQQRRRDTDKEKGRIVLITQTERFNEDLKNSRNFFRRAQLQAKRKEEEARRKWARDQLFAAVEKEGDPPADSRRRGKNENRTQEDIVLSAAEDVTAGLRRTHQLMTQELERSNFAHETLLKSTAALNSLNESYTGLDNLLKSSRSLISTLVSSQKSDTWYLETALKIGVATLIWLVFRRWFYGPVLYLVYRPSRFMLGAIYSVLNFTLGILTGTVLKLGEDTSVSASPSRAPLIIKPSASDRQPRRSPDAARPVVKVGLGGGGSAEGLSPEEKRKETESYNAWIAQMAEEKRKEEQEFQAPPMGDDGAAGGATTGDGTVLRERGENEPANPKKRMMEDPPKPPKDKGGSKGKDEL